MTGMAGRPLHVARLLNHVRAEVRHLDDVDLAVRARSAVPGRRLSGSPQDLVRGEFQWARR